MKGQMKRIVAVMLSIMMVFTLVPLSSVNAAYKAKLNKKSVTIYVGKTVQLKVNNNKKKVKWSTSNKKIATVTNKGKVKGKKAGKATITAKVGKKKYKCKVTVKKKMIVKPTKVPETTKRIEQPTTKPEQSTTKPIEETTKDDYGDNGNDWIVKSTSNRCWIVEYVGTDTDVVIPEKICGKPVVGFESSAFSYNKNITSVKIADGITSIVRDAFYGCDNLTNVVIPDSVTSIGTDAFWYCSLKSLTIPSSVTSIGNEAFHDAFYTTIDEAYFGWGFRSYIQKSKLINNSKLKPDGNEFYGAILYDYEKDGMYINDDTVIKADMDILEAYIPYGIKSIGGGAFMFCKKLKSFVLPNSVTNIGSYAFEGCVNLSEIIIPNSVTSIGENAFYGCYIHRNKIINNSNLKTEDNSSFFGARLCDYIEGGLYIADNSVVYANKNIRSAIIPDGITNVEAYVFTGCYSLTYLTIPSSVTNIDSYAFFDEGDNQYLLSTIIGKKGSYAEQWAKEKGYKFVEQSVEEPTSATEEETSTVAEIVY
ncbi:MAG: leucine-rich repeat domain-containing protein [Eubacterium ventriosum]|uniref:leucine-rich repeat domain-containing protein n=1 Tax=Eubacterium ventriosum TaxID=39496 RepID=UPI001E138B91|nr:leucine-rich repeat domain-containing protein [Eubacterium ventriosum]MBD9055729.1 leucine-rich repeat domain-containing protein [Eubacterium ventriosum]